MKHYVEIVKRDTEEVVTRLGPMTEKKAERVYVGASINLGDGYYVRFAEEDDEPTCEG